MVEEALAAADRQQASLRTQVTLLKQSHAAAQEEIVRLRSLLTQRNVTVPPIQHFHRQRPESYYVGDARDPDSDSVSSSSSERDSPRAAASQVPTREKIGSSDWLSFDMVATLMAGHDVDRIGVGFLNLPPVPLIVKRVTRGSWAEKQGIRCGDEFMSVDHRRSRAFTSSEFTKAMQKRPLHIKLRRTARQEGAEAESGLRNFGAIAEERSDSEEELEDEEEEEEEEDEDVEVEEMCPERAKEVAQKLAQEVAENARRERRHSTGSLGDSLRSVSLERRHSTGSDWRQEHSEVKELPGSPSTDAFSTSVESTPTVGPQARSEDDEFY